MNDLHGILSQELKKHYYESKKAKNSFYFVAELTVGSVGFERARGYRKKVEV